MIKSRTIAIIITLAILLSMSFGTILTKMTYSSVTPAAFVYLSTLIGIIAMNIYTFVIKHERIPQELMTRQVWSYIIQIAFFNFVLGTLSMFALNFMAASTNSYLSNFIGLITMALSIIILKEKPGIWQLLGAVIAFAGLRVFFPEPPSGNELLGAGMILVAITGVAYTNNIARKLAQVTENKISNNVISTLAITMGGFLAVFVYILIDGFPPVVPHLTDWLVIIYSGIVSKAIGLTVWNLILRTLRSYEASILGASSVIWTSILAVLILHEDIQVYQIIAIGMMLIGLSLVQVRGGSIKGLFKKKVSGQAEIIPEKELPK